LKAVRRNILLNPGPATTTDTVKNALVVPDICPREQEFGRMVEGIGADLVRIVHGEDDYQIALFGGSGTAVVDACINSVIPEGRQFLVVNNGAYGTRMVEIARAYGIDVLEYAPGCGGYPDMDRLASLLRQHEKVSHVGIVHHETTTGMLNPIERATELCHQAGKEIIVDAVSSYAGIPIDLRRTGHDYIISTSNKNIQGMAGIGFVIFRTGALEKMRTVKKRSYYLNLFQQHDFFRRTRQMQFTPPVQILYALRQAIDEYFAEGEQQRYQRYDRSWQTLVTGLRKIGFRLLLPDEQQSHLLTAIIEPTDPPYRFDAMHDYLYQRGYTIYPGKGAKQNTFRVANIGQIDYRDIEAFLGELERYVDEQGIRLS
jgi:2-aminoethylphosphonate-pyruvate transaminase